MPVDPKTLIHTLVSAIATTEGFFNPGTPPQRNHNPGDLIATPSWKGKVAGRFRVYPSDAEGIAAATKLVVDHIAVGHSLKQLISIWAPPSDGNNTSQYILETARRCGIEDPNVPLWSYLTVERLP